MIYHETTVQRLLRLRFAPNFPATREQAARFDRVWLHGLTHGGRPPKTLKDLLMEPRK